MKPSSVNDDLVSYLTMKNLPSADISSVSNSGSVLNSQVTEYFAKSLIQTIQYPGKPFIVQQKNKKKTARIKEPPAQSRKVIQAIVIFMIS